MIFLSTVTTFAMMKITTTWACLLLLCAQSFAQSPSKNHVTDWLSVASKQTVSQKNVINVQRLGADPTGKTPSDKFVQMALSNSKQTGAIIYFPKGEYLLNESIELSSNQYLAGDGSGQTTLRFDLGGKGHLIYAQGNTFASWTDIKAEAWKDETTIVTSNEFLKPGDLVRIRVNDNDRITSSWASGTVGQMTTIKSVEKEKITLSDGLRLDLTKKDEAKLIKILPQKNIGVVNMRIIRLDATSSQTDNIHFEYTQNALVSGVHSDSCNFAHVNNMYSYENRIEASYFTNAFNHGNGGKAYGVVLSFTSSQCMVENNIFEKLRHSVLFQAGPNGNIVGYNYSHSAYWTGVFSPADFAGDVVMHGNYPFLNLIEGNIIQNLVIDNSHGINGPGNTFLRNRIQNAGIFMNCEPSTNDQVFIGNEITGTGTSSNGYIPFPRGLYSLCGTGHYQFGNNRNGKMVPEQVNELVTSYYHPHKPNYLAKSAFPAVGYPTEYNKNSIPALDRNSLKIKTVDYEFDFELGIQFKSLTAKKDGSTINITWTTNTVDECKQFDVYRVDKGHETRITKIDCDGVKTNHFRYSDYNFDPNADRLGYFISCIDDYGQTIKSDLINVAVNQSNVGITSNGKGEVYFNYLASKIRVYDLKGHLISSANINARRHTLSNTLPSGMYVVEITSDNQIARQNIAVFR